MKLNDVGRITFRFAPREIAAMLMLMGARTLPGTGIYAAAPEEDVRKSLIGDGIVTQLGSRVLLDRTVTLILKTCIESQRRIEAVGTGGSAVLYVGERICVLIEAGRAIVTLEPFQNAIQARQPFEMAMASLSEPVRLSMYGKGPYEGEIHTPEMVHALLDELCGK